MNMIASIVSQKKNRHDLHQVHGGKKISLERHEGAEDHLLLERLQTYAPSRRICSGEKRLPQAGMMLTLPLVICLTMPSSLGTAPASKPEDILAAIEIRQVSAEGIAAFERPRDPVILPRPTCQFCHLYIWQDGGWIELDRETHAPEGSAE